MNKNSYLLAVGKKDEERLSLLNTLFSETSQRLLLKAGLTAGMRVLEIGCGTGNMTGWIANQVGKDGKVVAIDISEEQIAIAKEKNITHPNIEFIVQSIFNLENLASFDLIYSRFVIMHQTDPCDALKNLVAQLKPNGIIVCEEASNIVAVCHPQSETFTRYRELFLSLFRMKNLDVDFGSNIYTCFLNLNLKNITANFIQPLYQGTSQKKMMLLFLTEMKSQYVKNNLISEKDIDQLISDMRTFIQDDRYMVSFVRTTQIYGKRN